MPPNGREPPAPGIPRGDRTGHYVRPAKAGAFSGRQTRRGKSQSPVA